MVRSFLSFEERGRFEDADRERAVAPSGLPSIRKYDDGVALILQRILVSGNGAKLDLPYFPGRCEGSGRGGRPHLRYG
jgi:hypothetical protein